MRINPLTSITRKGVPLIVLSPHLDDAVLSCGALLGHASRRVPVKVITFFTEAGPPPHTLSTRRYLGLVGGASADSLYAARRAEDNQVLERMGLAWRHVGLLDGQFRRKSQQSPGRRLLPRLAHIYPTYRLHLARGRISPHDAATLRRVCDVIEEEASAAPALLVAPLGVGGHVDHLLVRTAAERNCLPTVYYSDFPYNQRHTADKEFAERHGLVEATWSSGLNDKAALIRGYESQVASMFPGGHIPLTPEVYLAPGDLVGGDGAVDGGHRGEHR